MKWDSRRSRESIKKVNEQNNTKHTLKCVGKECLSDIYHLRSKKLKKMDQALYFY